MLAARNPDMIYLKLQGWQENKTARRFGPLHAMKPELRLSGRTGDRLRKQRVESGHRVRKPRAFDSRPRFYTGVFHPFGMIEPFLQARSEFALTLRLEHLSGPCGRYHHGTFGIAWPQVEARTSGGKNSVDLRRDNQTVQI